MAKSKQKSQRGPFRQRTLEETGFGRHMPPTQVRQDGEIGGGPPSVPSVRRRSTRITPVRQDGEIGGGPPAHFPAVRRSTRITPVRQDGEIGGGPPATFPAVRRGSTRITPVRQDGAIGGGPPANFPAVRRGSTRITPVRQDGEMSSGDSETDICWSSDSLEWLPSDRGSFSPSPNASDAEVTEEEPSTSTASVSRRRGRSRQRASSIRGRSSSHGRGRSGGSSRPDQEWSETGWKPKNFPFTAAPGPINGAAALDSELPVDFVELFLTDALLQGIVEHTNRYAEQCIRSIGDQLPKSRVHSWNPITVPELKTFLGLFFLTGIIRKPSLKMYWSTDELIATPYFCRTMSRNRYQLIWRFLHFNDNECFDNTDRLYKVRSVLAYVVSKFQELYQPHSNICIDEGMLLWRGRLAFRVYNPQKPVKYGIKSYILCDSKTGYCFNMKPYCGEPAALGMTVVSLLDRLAGHGYRLYMDNFYNSVALCERLLDLDTHVCGTLRKHRGEPTVIRDITNSDLGIGKTIMRHNERVMVLAWRDKKIVKMVTSLHQNTMVEVEVWRRGQREKVPQQKPSCVAQYNLSMNGVDKLDQNLVYYPFTRRTAKWTKKFVTYLFEICLFNAFIIYKARNPQPDCSTFLSFLESVVKSWTSLASDGGEHVGEGEQEGK